VLDNVERVIVGKRAVGELLLVALLCEGHVLLEDVPGVGKTTLARSVARSIGGEFKRIQFTPDLLPSDIAGVTVFNQATGGFEFRPGGVFANIVVADEINRASPKTQSALLEVMEERAVTVDAERHEVPRPFMVVATQNPIDLDGTYRLPEAQLDRFLMRISVGYPDRAAELAIAAEQSVAPPLETLASVIDTETVAAMIQLATEVYVAPALLAYIVDLAAATRDVSEIRLGVSPRGMLGLVRAARVVAMLDGRAFAVPEDVKAVAVAVFAHRIMLQPEAELARVDVARLIEGLLARIAVPEAVTR